MCLLDKNKTNLIDYKSNNLHVVNYSESLKIDGKLEDIQDYIYTAKHMPDSIPYVTSYYSDLKGMYFRKFKEQTSWRRVVNQSRNLFF